MAKKKQDGTATEAAIQLSDLQQYIKAGYPGVLMITHEEHRATDSIIKQCSSLRFALEDGKPREYVIGVWSCTCGIVFTGMTAEADTTDLLDAIKKFAAMPNGYILVVKDFDLHVGSRDPLLIRTIKDTLMVCKMQNKHIVGIGCDYQLPTQLEKDFVRIDFSLPTADELITIARATASGYAESKGVGIESVMPEETIELVGAASSGMTSFEAENAYAKSIICRGAVCADIVASEKGFAIKKSGVLDVINKKVSFDDIGGLTELKSWVKKRKRAFTKEAREFGLPLPKGVLLFGVQGAGKTYTTTAIANELGVPMLRLDVGKLFGSLVGQSEGTTRQVIKQVEAFGACVLMIDELDKSFAGMKDASSGDSGTTRRVIGTFLTWMQDKTSPVFVVATANDLTKLPAELLRKGRWDELFFIDLPTKEERLEIWRVQTRLKGRNPDALDLSALADATDGWTGAEIEALFVEGMYTAFDMETEVTTESLLALSKMTQPLSKTMAADVSAIRSWASGRARSASSSQTQADIIGYGKRKLGVV